MSGEDHELVEARLYRFCPWCASPLVLKRRDGRERLSCPECAFIWYRNPVPAAGAFIIRGETVLMVKRRYPPRVGDWCFPAGFMEYDESPAECCIREIKEETGLDIKVTSLFWNYSGNDDPRSNAVLAMYLAEETGGELVAGDDALEVEFFHIDRIPDNIAFQAHREAIEDIRHYLRNGRFPRK